MTKSKKLTQPALSLLAGKCFSKVFSPEPHADQPYRWRLVGSGVRTQPEDAETTGEALRVCREAGIPIKSYWMGSPVNATSYHRDSRFLDGGLTATTGDYWYSEKGAWVTGARALLFIASALQLAVRPQWLQNYGLEGVTFEALQAELRAQLTQLPKF